MRKDLQNQIQDLEHRLEDLLATKGIEIAHLEESDLEIAHLEDSDFEGFTIFLFVKYQESKEIS